MSEGSFNAGLIKKPQVCQRPPPVASVAFEARKRYGLCVLDYMTTSNHIHLLVRENGGRDVIPKSIQLIAGRTGQEFNQRKDRNSAFWEDRYHATAVETGKHLIQCLVYIDLNMVRAGVVRHPSEWPFSGDNEIQAPRMRYGLTDYEELRGLLGFQSMHDCAEAYRGWIDESVKNLRHFRDGKWTESVAVGSRAFVTETKERLGVRTKGRKLVGTGECCELRESPAPYKGISGHENEAIRLQNEYYWENSDRITI